MCNLSEGIYEHGKAEGIAEGIAEGKAEVALNLRTMGMDDSQIAHALNVGVEIVKDWFKERS